jgi:hypothetical protein
VSPMTIWILLTGTCKFFGDALAERRPNVLPDLHLARIDRHGAVFSNVQPSSDFLGERFVRPLACAGFLQCMRVFQHTDNQNAGAEEFEEFAPIDFEAVRGRRGKFVAFGFQRNLGIWLAAHWLDSFMD